MRTIHHQANSKTLSHHHHFYPIISAPSPRLSPPIKFRRGEFVEVASDQEGFVGSYYEATVITDLVRGEYMIEYHNLIKDDLSGPLREMTAGAELRPKPPAIIRDGFRLNDVVDAFDNDGWWIGRITGRVEDKYIVFFDTTGDEIAYPKDRIRVHQNWINGNWVSGCNRVGI